MSYLEAVFFFQMALSLSLNFFKNNFLISILKITTQLVMVGVDGQEILKRNLPPCFFLR